MTVPTGAACVVGVGILYDLCERVPVFGKKLTEELRKCRSLSGDHIGSPLLYTRSLFSGFAAVI